MVSYLVSIWWVNGESHLCFETNVTNSLPWKANHDLKDQVGSVSVHCDTAKRKEGNDKNVQEAASKSLTGVTPVRPSPLSGHGGKSCTTHYKTVHTCHGA